MAQTQGNRLTIDGTAVPVAPEAEYTTLYRRFAELAIRGQVDVDLEPLKLAEQALREGVVLPTDPFEDRGRGEETGGKGMQDG